MGARLYNPTTGRFLQTDPVPGGTPAPFVYPVDPVLQTDLGGLCAEDLCVCEIALTARIATALWEFGSNVRIVGIFRAGSKLSRAEGSGVYMSVHEGEAKYVGQSVNMGRRVGEHLRKENGGVRSGEKVLRIEVKGDRGMRRKVEQALIDYHGGVKPRAGATSQLRNKINAIEKH